MKKFLTPLVIPEGKIGDWSIEHKVSPPGTVFSTANIRCQMFGGQKSQKISWPHETHWHYLKEGGITWMSDVPCEHAQTLDCLRGVRGRVLVGGLGLGLACDILARRKSVTGLTVVELQPEVVQLVSLHFTFPQGGRLTVVNDDLLKFLEAYDGPPFDHAFYDIWQSDGEGTFHQTVVPLLRLSRGKVRRRPVCWNEDVMRGQLVSGLVNRLWWLGLTPQEAEHIGSRQPATPLWEPDGTDEPWHNWAVPYWRWWHRAQPDIETARSYAAAYAHNYGTWAWEELWAAYTRA